MAKKVFAVYLAKEDVPNSEAYATLELPASPWELWDAMEKVRLKDGEALYMEIDDYYAFEYLASHLEELDISLNELNDLAARLATLDEVQGIAFEGLFSMEVQKKVNTNGGVITLQDLRDLAVSAKTDCYHVVDAADDAQLGRFYAENGFTNLFGDTSMAILQTCPTPKELSEMPLEELCHLIEVSSHKRFRMAKAQELQELARNSFGFAMAGDVFSTMIRLYARHLDFLKQQVREMDRKIAEIMETLDTPITTITGIGPTLGAYILSEIGDISRFPSAAKLAAYAGIDPTMRQSGEYNGVRNRMSKRGSPYLRHAIWLATSSAVLHNPALKLYFQKKRDEGKPYMASVGHACRKMVSIIYAVMRDNKAYTPYIPNEISA